MTHEVKRIVTELVGSLDGFAKFKGPKLVREPHLRKSKNLSRKSSADSLEYGELFGIKSKTNEQKVKISQIIGSM